MEITTETVTSDDIASPVKSDEYMPKSGCVTVMTAQTPGGLVSSDLSPGVIVTTAASTVPTSQSDSDQTHFKCHLETPGIASNRFHLLSERSLPVM